MVDRTSKFVQIVVAIVFAAVCSIAYGAIFAGISLFFTSEGRVVAGAFISGTVVSAATLIGIMIRGKKVNREPV